MCATRTLFSYLGSQLLPVLKDDESDLCHSSFIDDSSLLALLLMKAFIFMIYHMTVVMHLVRKLFDIALELRILCDLSSAIG